MISTASHRVKRYFLLSVYISFFTKASKVFDDFFSPTPIVSYDEKGL